MPLNASIKEINSQIKKKLEDGTYNIGELIAPMKFTKLKMKNDGTFCTETFTVEGRKIPLMTIRKQLIKSQEKMNIRTPC